MPDRTVIIVIVCDACCVTPSVQHSNGLGFRSKVGAAFEDKEEARKVRSGKYSLVDMESFQSPPASPGASKIKPAAK